MPPPEERKDMKIKYKFCDGTTQEIEVGGELYAVIQEIEQRERRLCWRDAKHRFSVNSLEDFLERNGLDIEAKASDPLSMLIRREESAASKKILGVLSYEQRELLELVYIDGKSMEEIAKAQGVKSGAVRQRMFRIMKRLERLKELSLTVACLDRLADWVSPPCGIVKCG